MKVQCLNSSSIKTRNLIKRTFAQLFNEKKQLDKVTVTELVKRADITRSTFYTHYDNIYDVAHDYELQTIELLCSDNLKLHSQHDIVAYFKNIIQCLKDNEEIYKLLLSANESLLFIERLKEIASKKIYDGLKDIYINKKINLDMTLSFFMNGVLMEILKYFRNESNYSLDDILYNMQNWFLELFF